MDPVPIQIWSLSLRVDQSKWTFKHLKSQKIDLGMCDRKLNSRGHHSWIFTTQFIKDHKILRQFKSLIELRSCLKPLSTFISVNFTSIRCHRYHELCNLIIILKFLCILWVRYSDIGDFVLVFLMLSPNILHQYRCSFMKL